MDPESPIRYDVTPPANGPVHVSTLEPRRRLNAADYPPGLYMEVAGQQKALHWNKDQPDPMTLPSNSLLLFTSGDKSLLITAGQLQDLDRRYPDQQITAKLAKSFINSPEQNFTLAQFNQQMAPQPAPQQNPSFDALLKGVDAFKNISNTVRFDQDCGFPKDFSPSTAQHACAPAPIRAAAAR